MTRRPNFDRARKRSLPGESASPNQPPAKGPWTHIKRQPVKIGTDEEKREWEEKARKETGGKLAYTIREACAATGLSRSTIYSEFKAGHLRKGRLAGRTVVLATDLAAYVANAVAGDPR